MLKRRYQAALVLAAWAAQAAAARAVDLSRETAPQRWLDAITPESLPALDAPEYVKNSPLDLARAQVAAGRYKLALYTLRGAGSADPLAAALVEADARTALGSIDRALEVLSKPGVAESTPALVRRAALLADLGHESEGIAVLRDLVRHHPDSLAARFELGRLLERTGDTAAAAEAYAWFVVPPQNFLDRWQGQGAKGFDDAADVTTLGRAVDRWAQLTGAYKGNPRLNGVILNMFVQAYDLIDRAYYPAHVAAAEYLLTHDDRGQAKEEIDAAMHANPRDPAALELAGGVAVAEANFPAALGVVDSLRSVDPDSLAADLIEGRALLRSNQARPGAASIARVLARRPNHLEALGLAAAAAELQLDHAGRDAFLRRADDVAPRSAVALVAAADTLADARQYGPAEAYYKSAVARAPWWAAPRHRLGLVYANTGDEAASRAALDAAHEIDPFHVATVNYLRLLDDMTRYARVETPHFVIVYDPAADPVVADYVGPYMEQAYGEVCGTFEFEPPKKTILEIFPTADAFSVRTAGVPGLESYGASLGAVISACSPRKGRTLGTYNFARVLRHEFTHSVNLLGTGERCPRWLTEGLAVREEHVEYRFPFVLAPLYQRASTGTLFTIETLGQALIRPKRPADGEVAYMEGFWISQFITERHGDGGVLRLLDAYKQGMSDADAFPAAVGQSTRDFETTFFAWAKQKVGTWGYDDETAKRFAAARDRADELTKDRQLDDAAGAWEECLKLQPLNSLPHRRLAGLYLQLKRPADAVPHLEAIAPLELQDNRYVKRIARAHRDAGDAAAAIRWALQAVYIDPYDVTAHELLAELYDKAGDAAPAAKERKTIVTLNEWKQKQATPPPAGEGAEKPAP